MSFIKRFFRYGLKKKLTPEQACIAYPELTRYLEPPESKYSKHEYRRKNAYGGYVLNSLTEEQAEADEILGDVRFSTDLIFSAASCHASPAADDLAVRLANMDASFAEKVFALIDERGLKDSEVYKKAHLDRRLFSKMRSNPDYQPSKSTACALCFALELTKEEAEALLAAAGFSLSKSSKWDLIVSYYLEKKTFDLDTVNLALYQFDQTILGGY